MSTITHCLGKESLVAERKGTGSAPILRVMPVAKCAVGHIWTGVRFPVQGETALMMRMNDRELANAGCLLAAIIVFSLS
jgi:hypothetical protein